MVGPGFDAVVEKALASLPDHFRNTVELIDVGGLSCAEAVEVLHLPVGTVMSRLHRPRGRIRDRLASAGLTPRHPMSIFSRRGDDRPLGCRQVGRILPRYLDRDLDEVSTSRGMQHLDSCRRRRLEAAADVEIKATLARRGADVPATTLDRLGAFGERLAREGPENWADEETGA